MNYFDSYLHLVKYYWQPKFCSFNSSQNSVCQKIVEIFQKYAINLRILTALASFKLFWKVQFKYRKSPNY